jgi:hypothetical protein
MLGEAYRIPSRREETEDELPLLVLDEDHAGGARGTLAVSEGNEGQEGPGPRVGLPWGRRSRRREAEGTAVRAPESVQACADNVARDWNHLKHVCDRLGTVQPERSEASVEGPSTPGLRPCHESAAQLLEISRERHLPTSFRTWRATGPWRLR